MKTKILISNSHNPYVNLSVEDWILNHLTADQQVLFLWRNGPTVVIGRNQNPWNEVNLDYLKKNSIYLARRASGGGAVYQDLGNTNFTLLSPKEHDSRENNNKIILSALSEFGIQGEASGRNDLVTLDQLKFSGSAFREKLDRAFHHGTMLMNADLTVLGQILTPNPKKLQAKGKESVRARVVNLNQLNAKIEHDVFCKAVIKSFENFYNIKNTPVEVLDLEKIQIIPEVLSVYNELSSWEWLYGKTLPFTHSLSEYLNLGFFDFQFVVEDAIIKDLKIYTDSLYPLLIDDMQKNIIGKSYAPITIEQAFLNLQNNYIDITSDLEQLKVWLMSQLE